MSVGTDSRRRLVWDSGSVFIAVGLFSCVVVNWGGGLRVVLAVLFTLVVPGRTVVGFLSDLSLESELVLTVAISIAIIIGINSLLFALGTWNIGFATGVLCGISILVLGGRMLRSMGRSDS